MTAIFAKKFKIQKKLRYFAKYENIKFGNNKQDY